MQDQILYIVLMLLGLIFRDYPLGKSLQITCTLAALLAPFV